jgi:hypothetical protein
MLCHLFHSRNKPHSNTLLFSTSSVFGNLCHYAFFNHRNFLYMEIHNTWPLVLGAFHLAWINLCCSIHWFLCYNVNVKICHIIYSWMIFQYMNMVNCFTSTIQPADGYLGCSHLLTSQIIVTIIWMSHPKLMFRFNCHVSIKKLALYVVSRQWGFHFHERINVIITRVSWFSR